MKKKQNTKSKVNLKSLKRLLKVVEKNKPKTKAGTIALSPYVKPTALVALSLLLIIGIFSYANVFNYFRGGISKAQIINMKTDIPLPEEGEARDDVIQDANNKGVVFLSHALLSSPPPVFDMIKYYDFVSGAFTYIALGGPIDFAHINLGINNIIYATPAEPGKNEICWHSLSNPLTQHTIPKGANDDDSDGDIQNGKIVFIRRTGSEENIWQYDIESSALKQVTYFNSDKKDVSYYSDDNGSKIVWTDDRNGNWDIYMYDFDNFNPDGDQITTNEFDQYEPVIHNNRIVWTDDRNGIDNKDIYMYDLNDEQEIQITTNLKNQQTADIYNNKIVWEDWRNWDGNPFPTGNADIYMHDLRSEIEITEYPVSTKGGDQSRPKIVQNRIMWTWTYESEPNVVEKDIQMATFDELNLTAPDNNIEFKFKEIKLEWEWSSVKPDLPNFYIRALLNGNPFTAAEGVLIGEVTSFKLPSTMLERYSDGEFEWSVLPEGLNEDPANWSMAESRIIIKKAAADLYIPETNTVIDKFGEEFTWETLDGATNYIARIGGFVPDQFIYLPLKDMTVPGDPTKFILGQGLYELLKNQPDPTYTWAVTGTGLEYLDQDIMSQLHYGETRTFTVE